MELLTLMRYLYQHNQKYNVFFSLRNGFLHRLFEAAKTSVPHNSRFFKCLFSLYNYNRHRVINLPRRHSYIRLLMNECLKVCTTVVNTVDKRKKAALLVGINYKNTSSELFGCENDIYATKKILMKHYGFKEADIMVLTEKDKEPTRENIMAGLAWLVKKADEGYGSLWFQYSGHGYYFKDKQGDEADGYDECIVTGDNYAIMDDEFRAHLVNKLRKDTKLFCLMDCCHSGTMLDLRFKYKENQGKLAVENKVSSTCDIIALSGCRDDQTSADAWFSGSWAGALTKNFLDVLKKHSYSPNLFEMVKDVRHGLQQGRFTQIPQLTSSKEVNEETKLLI